MSLTTKQRKAKGTEVTTLPVTVSHVSSEPKVTFQQQTDILYFSLIWTKT